MCATSQVSMMMRMEKHRNASPVNFKTIDNFDFAHVFFHVHYMFISSILGCWAVEKWCGGDRASKTANEVFWSAPEVSESGNCNWTGRSRGLGRHELRWCTQRHLVWALNALDLPWVFREQTIHFLVKPNGGRPEPSRSDSSFFVSHGRPVMLQAPARWELVDRVRQDGGVFTWHHVSDSAAGRLWCSTGLPCV